MSWLEIYGVPIAVAFMFVTVMSTLWKIEKKLAENDKRMARLQYEIEQLQKSSEVIFEKVVGLENKETLHTDYTRDA
jgi:uncharacterized protein YoxC